MPAPSHSMPTGNLISCQYYSNSTMCKALKNTLSKAWRSKQRKNSTVRSSKHREQTLQNWCQEDQVDLVEANSFSSIYQRNCHLALPLKRKAYERLLPRIRTEINTTKQQAAEKRQKVEEKLLLPVAAAPKPPKHKKSKPDGSNPKIKRNLTCAVCGGHRLFSANGLSDHTKAKHP